MKRDLDTVRKLLLDAEASEDRWFDIGRWEWTDHDMRETELNTPLTKSEVFHLDLMEQGGLIKKTVEEHSDIQMWEITWLGYEFLDASRSQTLWNRLKAEAKNQGISLSVHSVIGAAKVLGVELLSAGMAR